jgi:hypothetical protein
MTDRLADTALRLLAPRARAEGSPNAGDSDSLQNIITDELPNGSLCWVNSTEGLYRLDKTSTDAALVGIVIVPIAGPGRWILLSSGSSLAQFSAELFLIGTSLTTPAGVEDTIAVPAAGQWVPGPSVGAGPTIIYSAQISPVFISFDPFAGTLTYGGPTRRYLLQTYASIAPPTFSGTGLMAITANVLSGGVNDRIGLTTNDGTEAIESTLTLAPTEFQSLAAARSVELKAGDVIRPALTDTDQGAEPLGFDLTVRRLHLVATPFA